MPGALSVHGGDLVAVDCHAHVMRRDAPLAPDRHSAPKRDCTVEEYLSVLDANGISHGVLTAPSFYGTDNSLLLDALDRAAGRLRGTIIVDPGIDRASLAAMGARAIRSSSFPRRIARGAPIRSGMSTRCSTPAARNAWSGPATGRSSRTRMRSVIEIARGGSPIGFPTTQHGASFSPIRRPACSA